jgi:hypothetical protein
MTTGDLLLIIEENIPELSNNKVTTKNNKQFITILEKKIATNHIKIVDRMIRKQGSLYISEIKEG